jgi:hypothetical protein
MNIGSSLKENCDKWWCGYDQASGKSVIIEDFPALPSGDMLVHHLKVWSDRFPFIGETKGSSLMVDPGGFVLLVASKFPQH